MKVAGFEFESEEMALMAQKELQAVSYVKSKTRMDDPDMVLRLYKAMVEQNTFVTPVGMTFLGELQEYLYTIPYLKREDIPLIPVKKQEVQQKKVEEKKDRYKPLFRVTLFFSIVFLIIIGAMFTITYVSGNNVNIINYENAIIDKYEKWESELKEREEAIKRLEENKNE